MLDCSIIIPSRNENPKYALDIKKNANCPVYIVKNKLYGEAIKEGINKATTTYVITMDADGQHTLEEAEKLYKAFFLSSTKMMIGERRTYERGFIRTIGSLALNLLACCFAGRWVVNLNSGMRIFKRDLARAYEPILCDDFSYTTSLTMSFLADDYRVEWFPIEVRERQSRKSKVRPLYHGWVALWYLLKIGIALRTRKLRSKLRAYLSHKSPK